MGKPSFWERFKTFWKDVKAWAFKYLGALIMEEKDGKQAVSIGRVLLLVCFFVMLWCWRKLLLSDLSGEALEAALPDGLLEAFYALLGYVLSGKAVTAYRARAPRPGKMVAATAVGIRPLPDGTAVPPASSDDDLLS